MTEQTLAPAAARAGVGARLRRIARLELNLAAAQTQLEEVLEAARRRYGPRVEQLRGRLSGHAAELEQYCRAERHVLFPPDRKSLVTPFGEVGFRKGEATVTIREGASDEEACRRLRAAGLDALVRVREAPDRAAVRRALAQGEVSEARLRSCALEVVEGDERFHCRTAPGLGEGAAAAAWRAV